MKRLAIAAALMLGAMAYAGEFQYGFITETDILVESSDPQTVIVHLDEMPGVTILAARLVMEVYDPDYADEGQLFINDQFVMELFGDQASGSHDTQVVEVAYDLDPAFLMFGDNVFTFTRIRTLGYGIMRVELQFDALFDPDGTTDPSPPPGEYVTVAEFNLAVDTLRQERDAAINQTVLDMREWVKQLLRDAYNLALSVFD